MLIQNSGQLIKAALGNSRLRLTNEGNLRTMGKIRAALQSFGDAFLRLSSCGRTAITQRKDDLAKKMIQMMAANAGPLAQQTIIDVKNAGEARSTRALSLLVMDKLLQNSLDPDGNYDCNHPVVQSVFKYHVSEVIAQNPELPAPVFTELAGRMLNSIPVACNPDRYGFTPDSRGGSQELGKLHALLKCQSDFAVEKMKAWGSSLLPEGTIAKDSPFAAGVKNEIDSVFIKQSRYFNEDGIHESFLNDANRRGLDSINGRPVDMIPGDKYDGQIKDERTQRTSVYKAAYGHLCDTVQNRSLWPTVSFFTSQAGVLGALFQTTFTTTATPELGGYPELLRNLDGTFETEGGNWETRDSTFSLIQKASLGFHVVEPVMFNTVSLNPVALEVRVSVDMNQEVPAGSIAAYEISGIQLTNNLAAQSATVDGAVSTPDAGENGENIPLVSDPLPGPAGSPDGADSTPDAGENGENTPPAAEPLPGSTGAPAGADGASEEGRDGVEEVSDGEK